jgi:hypothetical protein
VKLILLAVAMMENGKWPFARFEPNDTNGLLTVAS